MCVFCSPRGVKVLNQLAGSVESPSTDVPEQMHTGRNTHTGTHIHTSVHMGIMLYCLLFVLPFNLLYFFLAFPSSKIICSRVYPSFLGCVIRIKRKC